MNELVRRCSCRWTEAKDYCRLSASVKGWGCRLLVCIPDRMPRNDKNKAKLFHEVYSYAEKVGVLGCPFFHEKVIDDVLDTPKNLREMVLLSYQT